jgi:hypothetical protein
MDEGLRTYMEYVEVPGYATRLPVHLNKSPMVTEDEGATSDSAPNATAQQTDVPPSSGSSQESPTSPRRFTFNITSAIMSSGLLTDLPPAPHLQNAPRLMSNRDPLSIPLTTTNFRRFAARTGPVFWIQDRIEEIVTWKKGWKATAAWMAAYAFLCETILVCANNCLTLAFQVISRDLSCSYHTSFY